MAKTNQFYEESVDKDFLHCYDLQTHMACLLSARPGRFVWALVAVLPALSLAQPALLPTGSETAVIGSVAGDQIVPSASFGAAGGYVVWQDSRADGNGFGISALRLDPSWTATGLNLRVNRTGPGDQVKPQASLLNDGGAVFVWEGGKPGFPNVFARFLAENGTFRTADLRVDPALTRTRATRRVTLPSYRNNRFYPAKTYRLRETVLTSYDMNGGPVVATLAGGDVVVAYVSSRRITTTSPVLTTQVRERRGRSYTNSVLVNTTTTQLPGQDVYFRRFTPAGRAQGTETRANVAVNFNQRNVAVAPLRNGNFVLVWTSENQGLTEPELRDGVLRLDVIGRVFDVQGEPVTGEFVINPGIQLTASPRVAALGDGGFRVVWAERAAEQANGWDIFTRSFSAEGVPGSEAERLNQFRYGDQFAPQIAAGAAGELVVWTSMGQDGQWEGVFGQFLREGKIAASAPGEDLEFQVNTTTVNRQWQPAVATDGGNRFYVFWAGLVRGTGFDLMGQRYTAVNP